MPKQKKPSAKPFRKPRKKPAKKPAKKPMKKPAKKPMKKPIAKAPKTIFNNESEKKLFDALMTMATGFL